METMYDRIKRMTESEMQEFIYWVYSCGNQDGQDGLEDSPGMWSYFGGYMLTQKANKLMPNGKVSDLWERK